MKSGENNGSQTGRTQRGDYRPRRPRQDHARRRNAQTERHFPRKRTGGGTRDGLQRPRARTRHHHPFQKHRDPLQKHEDQHRRHPGARRFRRRGGTHSDDGGRRAAARRRLRGLYAADTVRAQKGARAQKESRCGGQQDRPPRRAAGGSDRRGARSVHRARRGGGSAGFPRGLRLSARRILLVRSRRQKRRHAAAARFHSGTHRPAAGRSARPAADPLLLARLRRLYRPDRHRPRGTRQSQAQPDRRPLQAGRLDPRRAHFEAVSV